MTLQTVFSVQKHVHDGPLACQCAAAAAITMTRRGVGAACDACHRNQAKRRLQQLALAIRPSLPRLFNRP